MPTLIGQGRQDWQRIDPHDSLVLFDVTNVLLVGNRTFGPFNLAGFEQFAGHITMGVPGNIQVDVAFFADSTFLTKVGTRSFAIDGNSTPSAQLSMRALGSWCTITLKPQTAGTTYTWSAQLAAVNRVTELPFTPQNAVLAAIPLQSIAGGGVSLITNHAEIYAGPISFSLGATAAGCEPYMECQTSPTVWQRVFQGDMVGSNHFRGNGVLPPLPCRTIVNNPTGAAISVVGSVIASLTGGA